MADVLSDKLVLRNGTLTVVFFLLLLFSMFGIIAPNSDVGDGVNNVLGYSVYWLAIVAIGGLAYFGYFAADRLLKIQKFNSLMKIDSKQKFIKALDELEKLAWYLKEDYHEELEKKRRKLHIPREKDHKKRH